MSLPLQAEDVYSLRQPTRSLMEAGRVFAVHQVKGVWKCARLTVSGGSVCLHALQDQTLPVGAATLQVRPGHMRVHVWGSHGRWGGKRQLCGHSSACLGQNGFGGEEQSCFATLCRSGLIII